MPLFSASDLFNRVLSFLPPLSLLSLHLDLLVCKPLSFLRKPSQGPAAAAVARRKPVRAGQQFDSLSMFSC